MAEDASGAFVADGSPISLISASDASYYSGLPGDTLGVDGNSLPVYDIQPFFPAGIADLFDDATYLDSVSMIRVEQSEINGLRARNPQEDPNFQPWDEEFVSYELFQPDTSTTPPGVERIARVEVRDGLVEFLMEIGKKSVICLAVTAWIRARLWHSFLVSMRLGKMS